MGMRSVAVMTMTAASTPDQDPRQEYIQREHRDEDAHQEQRILGQVDQRVDVHVGQGSDVIGDPRRETTGRGLVEVAERETLDVLEELDADVVHDTLTNDFQQEPVAIRDDQHDRDDDEEDEGQVHDPGPVRRAEPLKLARRADAGGLPRS